MHMISIVARNAVNPVAVINPCRAWHKEWYVMFAAHSVIRLVLTSGEVLLLDVAGAQFGWREPIAPLDKWCGHRAVHVDTAHILPISDHLEKMRRMSLSPKNHLGEDLRTKMAESMVSLIIKEAEQRSLSSPLALLRLPPSEYDSFEHSVVQAAQEACLRISQDILTTGRSRWYRDSTPADRVTQSLEQAEDLEGVWLTAGEFRAADGDTKALQVMWARRCLALGRQATFARLGMKMRFPLPRS